MSNRKETLTIVFCGLLLLATPTLYGQVLGGRVAMNFAGVLQTAKQIDQGTQTSLPNGTAALAGYFTYIAGIPGVFSLPANCPNEQACLGQAAATFTFRSSPFSFADVTPFQLGGVIIEHSQPQGATINVYLNQNPTIDPSNLDTFSAGQLVATFQLLGDSDINFFGNPPSVMSAQLTWSASFQFNGATYNFKKIVPNGITLTTFSGGGIVYSDGCFGVGGTSCVVTNWTGGSATATPTSQQ